jgi:prepilin-type N-terminal cleavage/methylation domain-containing protein
MRRGHPPAGRGGFTLIELLVAAALSLVVMTVLSLAFQTGMQSLSQLKSVVGLSEQLRAAEGILRRDLAADHLEDIATGKPVAVSQLTGAVPVTPGTATPLRPSEKGFFRFVQGESLAAPGGPLLEGGSAVGSDTPLSFRTPSAAANPTQTGRAWADYLAFTVRLPGDGPQNVFTAQLDPAVLEAILRTNTNSGPFWYAQLPKSTDKLAYDYDLQKYETASPPRQFYSRWAEVAYFLVPSGAGTGAAKVFARDEAVTTELPLYTLYRRQRVLAPATARVPLLPVSFAHPALATTGANVGLTGSGAAVLGPEGVFPSPLGTGPSATAPAGVGNPEVRLGGASDPLAQAISAPNGTRLRAVGSLPATAQPDQQARPYPIPNEPTLAAEYGSDVLLNNVVSMTVRPVFSFTVPQPVLDRAAQNNLTVNPGLPPLRVPLSSPNPRDMIPVLPAPGLQSLAQYESRATFPRSFDTGTLGTGIPIRFPTLTASGGPGPELDGTVGSRDFFLKGIEVKLRVYDAKNRTTRQTTIVVDL